MVGVEVADEVLTLCLDLVVLLLRTPCQSSSAAGAGHSAYFDEILGKKQYAIG